MAVPSLGDSVGVRGSKNSSRAGNASRWFRVVDVCAPGTSPGRHQGRECLGSRHRTPAVGLMASGPLRSECSPRFGFAIVISAIARHQPPASLADTVPLGSIEGAPGFLHGGTARPRRWRRRNRHRLPVLCPSPDRRTFRFGGPFWGWPARTCENEMQQCRNEMRLIANRGHRRHGIYCQSENEKCRRSDVHQRGLTIRTGAMEWFS